ncbi:hypothetical protein PHYBLDRAFT_62196 [Phycomyces blakesleeanus NRRL 1555(-)]|uniref:ISXO2-like transposase domain-containing protein n=1 Tax=Phycomyces blakesleeanus (strain ATCC 8743b / DSM 1359 / FGSC 10004 / NBRC 33097 / NRRL 1555) TaxID=763407 RepID=A0A167Q470_PHYB8|nr:hypothetical protein PHYBLDRAFT_62196 [Phycomyces blakesleeanus NRRL 1555(-)]OAD79039.1 hypothetical protein PHYBLDRAFT_62196 [Phycomyces blakesleeanus NRRL 1555(-)]|eukprot:XP_018297079.1 hypothetical protein PHYBLDRAFT_62196 [Phycomyces blakesleeanus NRRL 1555(-)]
MVEQKTFLMAVPQRDAATLLQVIKMYVNHNRVIHTDCWTSYGRLLSVFDMNYTHRTVNHNVEYIIFDGLWNAINMSCKTRLRTRHMMPWMLIEFIWKKYENRLWQEILKMLAEISFGSNVKNPIFITYEYLEDDKNEEYTDFTMF